MSGMMESHRRQPADNRRDGNGGSGLSVISGRSGLSATPGQLISRYKGVGMEKGRSITNSCLLRNMTEILGKI